MRSGSTAAFVTILMLGLASCGSQGVVAEAYFGLELPGTVPQIFAPGIVSLDGNALRESDIAFWPDGQKCIFARFGDGIPDFTIFEARDSGDGWTNPVPSDLFPGGGFEPSISPDGERILFNLPDFSQPHGESILQMMALGADGWSAPISLFKGLYASASLDGTLYYTTFYRNKDHIAYRVLEDGDYGPENLLGSNVFSALHEDAHPCIAPDGSYLIFDSESRPRSNACWLFVTFRNEDGSWTNPTFLGDVLGDLSAALARISPDGKYIFFKAEGDIYWVDASVLDSLR